MATKSKQLNLCGHCAELMKDGYALKRIAGGVDNKVKCDHCGRRRYGATYELSKKKTE